MLPQTHTFRVPRENRRGIAHRRDDERSGRPVARIREGAIAPGALLHHGDPLRHCRDSARGWCRGMLQRSGDGAANGPMAAPGLPLTPVGPNPLGLTLAAPGFHRAASIAFPCCDGEPASSNEPDDAARGAQRTPVPSGLSIHPHPLLPALAQPRQGKLLAAARPALVPLLVGVSGGFGWGDKDLGHAQLEGPRGAA